MVSPKCKAAFLHKVKIPVEVPESVSVCKAVCYSDLQQFALLIHGLLKCKLDTKQGAEEFISEYTWYGLNSSSPHS